MTSTHSNSISVITLGLSGFPLIKAAPIVKCIFLNKSLLKAGFNPLIINNKPIPETYPTNFINHGFYDDIEYRYVLNSAKKSKSFIMRRIMNFWAIVKEIVLIVKLNQKNKIKSAILFPNGLILQILRYWILSRLLRFKLIVIYHEFKSDYQNRKRSVFLHLNDRLFDQYFIFIADAFLPISDFLVNHIKGRSPHKPQLKIPPLTEFATSIGSLHEGNSYFLYCGSAGYIDIIEFIIQSFNLLEHNKDYYLYLVVGGSGIQMKKVEDLIEASPKCTLIKLFSNLPSEDLNSLYKQAKALLIPLRPNIRDRARFPQKIAEYSASGAPIITTNFGEIQNYFSDSENALIADEYQIESYAEKLEFIINNPTKSNEIGKKGKLLGEMHFDYRKYSEPLKNFLTNI